MVKVKEFIARVGIKSLDELAEKLELSPATVYSWSQGKRAPTYDVCVKLRRLGMTDYELFGEVFPTDEEFYKNRVMRSVDRFLADIGIYTKEKV